jgi:hypothetical protein
MSVCLREPLKANRTYYVRTDGNDSNSGLANDAAGAFLTIQKAVNVACTEIDFGLFTCTIQVGAGTYAEAVSLKPYVGATVPVLRGDNATPANVVIAPSAGHAIFLGGSRGASVWNVEGFKLTSATATGMVCSYSGSASCQNLEFGTCANYQFWALAGGFIQISGDYRISGGAQGHMAADATGAQIRADLRTITVIGTPNFSRAFAIAARGGALIVPGVTFVGSATGVRYEVSGNGVIDTNGAGPSFFPGNSTVPATTGGQYY